MSRLGTQSLVSNLIWHYLLDVAINAYINCLISLYSTTLAIHYIHFLLIHLLPINAINFYAENINKNAFIIINNISLFSVYARSQCDIFIAYIGECCLFFAQERKKITRWRPRQAEFFNHSLFFLHVHSALHTLYDHLSLMRFAFCHLIFFSLSLVYSLAYAIVGQKCIFL